MKMVIRGASMTPAITPAMPRYANIPTGKSNPKILLHRLANRNPAMLPAKSVGAKSPPTPPLQLVDATAKHLNNNMPAAHKGRRVAGFAICSKMLPFARALQSPLIILPITGYPTLNMDGKIKIIIPNIRPPVILRLHGLLILLKTVSILEVTNE